VYWRDKKMKTIFMSLIGLEERVLGIFREDKVCADKYLLFVNTEFEDDYRVKTYRKEITEKHLAGEDYRLLKASYTDPLTILTEINKFITEEKIDFGENKVILDVSTFNRQNLLIILRMLRKVLSVPDIELIYTVPEEVNPELSRGAMGFANTPFFDGNFLIDKKKLLILLLGYEVDRPLLLWKELEPSRVILAEGFKPTVEKFYERNRKIVEELQKIIRAEVIQISADDPWKASYQLSDIFKRELPSYNIFVSPLNTKLQTIGLYLAWEKNPDIQITLSFPDRFSGWLTKGVREVRRYKL